MPLLAGDSEIVITSPLESKAYVDLTIDILKVFGIEVENYKYKIFRVKGGQKYKPTDYKVEGDYSQAAFFLVAGAIGCNVECLNLNPDSLQGDKAILDIIKETGCKVVKGPNGGIMARRSGDHARDNGGRAGDPRPRAYRAVLLSFCKGESRIVNAGRLRLKESDRLRAISTELRRLGVDITEGSDYLKIRGRDLLEANVCSSWNDHRIAMALAIAACRTEGTVTIVGAREAVKKSYPDFFRRIRDAD